MIKRFWNVLIILLFPITLIASETDTYNFSWLDPDKEVYVLQNRKYRKSGKFYVNAGGGITTTGAFVDSTNIQGRVGFFFKEEWGIEGLYSMNSGSENETAKSVRGDLGTSGSTPFRRITDNYYGVMLMWAPFYSKINTFNKIIYVDWLFGVGYGSIEETNNKTEFLTGATSSSPTTESHSGILWQTALKFYLSENWDIRLNLASMNYKADQPSNNSSESVWNDHYDLTVSLGFTF